LFAFIDFVGQSRRGGLRQTGNDAQTTGIGYGGGHFSIADIMHAALNNWMLNIKEFGNSCFHSVYY